MDRAAWGRQQWSYGRRLALIGAGGGYQSSEHSKHLANHSVHVLFPYFYATLWCRIPLLLATFGVAYLGHYVSCVVP
jgi:hypothetical protein